MITWIVGESGSGKSHLAKAMQREYRSVWLDGDMMRRVWEIGFSQDERREHNLRIARLARELDEQGHDVIVSTICPTDELKEEVKAITRCKFININ